MDTSRQTICDIDVVGSHSRWIIDRPVCTHDAPTHRARQRTTGPPPSESMLEQLPRGGDEL
jgi:hypothetical protein